jgi:hypothetical protein
MEICEPSRALFTVSGLQTDALVSDYNSKDRPSIAQEARWLEPPAVEWPARQIFASSIAQPPYGNSEHLSTLLRELPTRVFTCPKSDSAPGISVEVSNRFGPQSNTALAA